MDLAEVLVERGVPFRDAHEAVGGLVAALIAEGRSLDEAAVDDLTAAHDAFEAADLARIDPVDSVHRRATPGGGHPDEVHRQVEALRKRLATRD